MGHRLRVEEVTSLANATQDVIRSAEEQNEKENLFCLCLTIVVA